MLAHDSKAQQDDPSMLIPLVIALYVLLLTGLGASLWYESGHVSAVQRQANTRAALWCASVLTMLALVAIALSVVAAAF